jgi:hypothetical protein
MNGALGHIWNNNYSLLGGQVNYRARLSVQGFGSGTLLLQFYNGSGWTTHRTDTLTSADQTFVVNFTDATLVAQGIRLNMTAETGPSIYLGVATLNYSVIVPETSAKITALDIFNSTAINTFNATISSTTYTTTNGTLILPFNATDTSLFSIVVESPNYFSRAYEHNFSTSGNSTLTAQLVAAYVNINATELYSNAQLTGGNYTINGVTREQTTPLNISAGTFSITYAKNGYVNKTQVFSISPLFNGTLTVENLSSSSLNLSIVHAYTGAQLNATVNITVNSYAVPNIYYASVNATNISLLNGSYSLYVTYPNYITIDTTLNISAGVNSYRVLLYPDNTFNFTVYDESTLSPLTNVNWTVTSQAQGGYSLNGSTTIGNFAATSLPQGLYEVRYTPSGYQPRSYFIVVPATDPANVNLSLYSVLNTTSLPFVITVTDQYNQYVDGLTLSLLRRYIISNQTTFYVVEQAKPVKAQGGATVMYAIPNTVPYLFRVTDASGTVRYQGSAATASSFETLYLIDQNLYIKIGEADSEFTKILGVQNSSVNLYNSTATNTFWLSYSSRPPSFEQTCLVVVENAETVVHNQCYTQDSAIVSYTIPTPTNGSTYAAVAVYKDADGQDYVTGSATMSYKTNPADVWSIVGLAVLILTIVVFAFMFADSPHLIVAGSVLAILGWTTSFIGITTISLVVQGTIFVAAFILMMMLPEEQ